MTPSRFHGHAAFLERGISLILISALAALMVVLLVMPMAASGAKRVLVLSPPSGPAGTEVAVTGSGFPANAATALQFDGADLPPGDLIYIMPTDAAGEFTALFRVPAGTADGDYPVKATASVGNKSQKATADFTVSHIFIVLSPNMGVVGSQVNVTGGGFAPNVTSVMVKVDSANAQIVGSCPGTNGLGELACTFTIPSLPAGPHVVSVTVGVDTATAPITVIGAS